MYLTTPDVLFYGVAVGVDTETGNSVVLRTANEGEVWRIYDNNCIQNGLKQGAINTFSVFYSGGILLGGDNGLFYQGNLGNQWLNEVDPRPEGLTKNVKSYHAINFILLPLSMRTERQAYGNAIMVRAFILRVFRLRM